MKQYSVVKILVLNKVSNFTEGLIGSRLPMVGDIACIVEVYGSAFELECCGKNGETIWLETFEPEDAKLELIQL